MDAFLPINDIYCKVYINNVITCIKLNFVLLPLQKGEPCHGIIGFKR